MNSPRFKRSFGFRHAMLLTAGCFALIALGVTVITVISRNYSRGGTQQTKTLTGEFLPGLVTLARLQDAALNLKSITYQFALARDEEAMKQQRQAFQNTTVLVTGSVAQLKLQAKDEPTQRLIATFAADVQGYRECAEKFQTELGAGEFEKAMTTLDQEVGPAQKKIETQLATLSEQYFQLSNDAGVRTAALLAQSDRFGLIATVVLTAFTLLCLVLSLAATRALLAQVQKRDAERQAAQDTLEKRVEERTLDLSRKNEQLQTEVAERQRAQQQLAEKEHRLRSILESEPECVKLVAADGTLLEMNPAGLKMIEADIPEKVMGHSVYGLIAPEHHAVFRTLNAAVFQGESRFAEFEIIGLKGTHRWMQTHACPLRNAEGEIVAQLAVTRDVTEVRRVEAELANVHKELMLASRQAGMAEVATSVLHNVGNVLNSVNTSVGIATDKVARLKAAGLGRVAGLLNEHAGNLPAFFTEHPQGTRLPMFLTQLAEHFATEQQTVLRELDTLRGNVEHINEIVAMQQRFTGSGGVVETLPLTGVIEDALRMNASAFARHGTHIVREFDPNLPPMPVDRNKLLLILMNLVRNAKYACDEGGGTDKRVTVRAHLNGDNFAKISVSDNGIGIPPENFTRIFEHGFTTRKQGHGFGLHSSALAASEMGGSLRAHSDGPGQGATFTIEIPLTPANS